MRVVSAFRCDTHRGNGPEESATHPFAPLKSANLQFTLLTLIVDSIPVRDKHLGMEA
jgi:hypothetical protein